MVPARGRRAAQVQGRQVALVVRARGCRATQTRRRLSGESVLARHTCLLKLFDVSEKNINSGVS